VVTTITTLVTTTAAATAIAATAIAAAAATRGTGIGQVDTDLPSIELVFIQGLNCRLGFRRSAERDESEAAAPAGVAVPHDYGVNHVAMLGKSFS
jgi:hypothetical protein